MSETPGAGVRNLQTFENRVDFHPSLFDSRFLTPAPATFTTTSLSPGKHTITATYADNTGYTFSTSNTWVETVTQRTLTILMPSALSRGR